MPESREEAVTKASRFLNGAIKDLEDQIIDLRSSRSPSDAPNKIARAENVISNHNGHIERLSLALRSIEYDGFKMEELWAVQPAITDYVKHGRHYGLGHVENFSMYERLLTWWKDKKDNEKRDAEKKQKQQQQTKSSWDLSRAQASDESKSITIWALEAMAEALRDCILQLTAQPEGSKRRKIARIIGMSRQPEVPIDLGFELGASPSELVESLTRISSYVELVRDKAKRLRPELNHRKLVALQDDFRILLARQPEDTERLQKLFPHIMEKREPNLNERVKLLSSKVDESVEMVLILDTQAEDV